MLEVFGIELSPEQTLELAEALIDKGFTHETVLEYIENNVQKLQGANLETSRIRDIIDI